MLSTCDGFNPVVLGVIHILQVFFYYCKVINMDLMLFRIFVFSALSTVSDRNTGH